MTRTFSPSDGSRTVTITPTPASEHDGEEGKEGGEREEGSSSIGTLRLTGGLRRGQRVMWDEDVVDNEGAGKKKSKICCIYHKERKFDESSSDDDESSSCDDSDSSGDEKDKNAYERMPGKKKKKKKAG